MPQLKRLSKDGIPAALEKAMRYRLLNEPARPRASASTCPAWNPTTSARS